MVIGMPSSDLHCATILLDVLRRWQVDLELPDEALERVCGFASGAVDQYVGPSGMKARPRGYWHCRCADSASAASW
jgi:hypothetical protein